MPRQGAPHRPARNPIRVVLADDQLPFRIALRQMLRRASDVEVVGEAADGAQAIALVEQLTPDLVLLDVRIPVLDGPTAAREITARWPQIAVVPWRPISPVDHGAGQSRRTIHS